VIQLAVYAIIVAAIAAALGVLHHSIYSQGEQDGIANQVKADKIVVDRVTAERDEARAAEKTREAETGACKAAVGQQNAALEQLAKQAEALRASNAALLAQAAAARKERSSFIDQLRVQATAAPKGDRNAQCDAADAIAGDALRRVREQP
jgi:hypothetical protein